MEDSIALVNKNDDIIGYSDKYTIHKEGLLHRAFSIFVFNSLGELLLHRRAMDKYHSPGLWTNTCCSHLPENMEMKDAIQIRLQEEMGFDTNLFFVDKFHYRIDFDNELTENEIDHIYVGFFDVNPMPNSKEVSEYEWVTLQKLKQDVENYPSKYTYWLKHILENSFNKLEAAQKKVLQNI